jgi:hypothetical protein
MRSTPASVGSHQVCSLVAPSPYWAHFAKPLSKYVLYDAATKTTYQLDDQLNVQPYVGETVQITGTLNAATKMIHAIGIKKS